MDKSSKTDGGCIQNPQSQFHVLITINKEEQEMLSLLKRLKVKERRGCDYAKKVPVKIILSSPSIY